MSATLGESSSSGIVTSCDAVSLLPVSIDGKPAQVGYDHEFLIVVRGNSTASLTDPACAHLRVPLALVLNTSFVADSDGGSLLISLLSPPIQPPSAPGYGFSLFRKVTTQPVCMNSLSAEAFKSLTEQDRSERLRQQLSGPCGNLRFVRIEARVLPVENENEGQAAAWARSVLAMAYTHTEPYRRLKVLVNPVGGSGKAGYLFDTRVRPILEAAGCKLDVTLTTRRMHGLDIAKDLQIDDYDAIGLVSGDGLIHEVLNGLASRPDSKKALQLPIAPIPAGSGNAMAINLMGVEQGFSLALACLNLIKGRPMYLDLLTVTQPASAFSPGEPIPGSSSCPNVKASNLGSVSGQGLGVLRASDDTARPIDPPSKPYVQFYSFLSQAIGIAAELDLGTENMRAIGDTRFLIGYATSVLRNASCDVDIDIKLGPQGCKSKAEMRARVAHFIQTGQSSTTDQDKEVPIADAPLAHGPVTEPLSHDGTNPPPFDLSDPSWPSSLTGSQLDGDGSSQNGLSPDDQSSGWYRITEPIASLCAGKMPFVGRDLMQFPYAIPHDGLIDLTIIVHAGGRIAKIPMSGYAESGQVVYQKSVGYVKVEALRVTPHLPQGDKRLKNGGLISIDGEKVAYAPFQVQVAKDVVYAVCSLFGRFCVPVVPPPAS